MTPSWRCDNRWILRLAGIAAACGLLAACGHPRQRAYEVLQTNPTLYVVMQPHSMAYIAAARLKGGDATPPTVPAPKFMTAYLFPGDMAQAYERERDMPPTSTYQPMTVGQLMGALTNAPTVKGIIFRSMAFTTNELARLKPRVVPRPDEKFRIQRTR